MEQTRDVIFQYLRFGHPNKIVTDVNGVQYKQVARGPRRGVVAATLVNGKISVGITLLSPKEPFYTYTDGTINVKGKEKKVNKRVKNIDWSQAINTAIERAKNGPSLYNPRLSDFSAWQRDQILHFMKRCGRYFKDANLIAATTG